MLQNPQAAMMQALANNPQLRNVIEFIKQNGNNPKDAFYAAARQMGVNPEEILRELQN